MRKILLMILLLSQVVIRTMGESVAQNTYYNISAITMGATTITACGTDSTMQSATNSNLATSRTVYRFVKDSAPTYARNAISITTTGSGTATYTTTTGVINIPTFAQYVPTVHNNVVKAFNTNYTLSVTQNATYVYSIQASITLAIGARTATIAPQISLDGGSTWVSLPYVAITPALAGIGLISTQILQVNGTVPANALFKIAPTAVTGITYTYIDGQEVY